MATDLPTNIDATYADRSPGDTAHQQYHDTVHGVVNEVSAELEGRLSEAGLNAAYAGIEAPKLQTNTVIIFGDSITQQNGTGPSILDPAAGSRVAGRGYWNWANAYLDHRATLVRNAGIGGNTTGQMLARIQADVITYASDWVVVCGGANDVANDTTAATTQANLTAILDALEDDGRRVLLTTIPPSGSYSTTARRTALTETNKWIRTLPLSRRNVVVADVWRVLADPATGSPATGMAIDVVHPSEPGAQRMGKAVAHVLDPLMPYRPNRTIGLLDTNNVIGNPHFGTGTGWSILGGAGVTAAYSTPADRWGSKAVLTFSGVADTAEHGIQYVEPITNGRYAAGDIIQVSARFKWSGATALGVATQYHPLIRVMPRLADNSFPGPDAFAFFVASAETVAPVGNDVTSGEIVSVSNRITLPTNVANLYVAVGWYGMASGTVEVSDLAVYKNA